MLNHDCILFLQVCQDSQASDSVILPEINHFNSPEPEISCINKDKSTMTDTTSKMIQDVEKLASSLQEQVNRLEQEKKQQVNQWEDQAKGLKEKITALEHENVTLKKMYWCLSTYATKIANDDRKTHFYTGLPSYNVFDILVSKLSPVVAKTGNVGSGMSPADELILVLMKLSQGTTNQDLAYRFNIDMSKVTKVFHLWIDVLAVNMKSFITWPDREMIVTTLPQCFKSRYSKVVCIIDCSEIFIQRPTAFTARAQTYSNYKSHNTVKFLVAISPTGAITFVSKCWGGRVSDKHLTVKSGFLRHLIHGDLVIADRGFDIADELALVGASLAIPPFTKGKSQLSQREVELSRHLSHVRIHVERAIGRIKRYRILQSTLPIVLLKRPHETELCTIDKILITCCALSNLHPPLV